jgi:hypothetical protein
MISLEKIKADLRSRSWLSYWNKPLVWVGLLGVALSIISFRLDGTESQILLLVSGILIGLFVNHLSSEFGSDRDLWLPTAESSCKQIVKSVVEIDNFIAKERGTNSFCSTLAQNESNSLLVRKHCESVDMKLSSLRGDLLCMFSDWQHFINSNCKMGECEYIWERVYSILPNNHVDPYEALNEEN